MTNRRPLKSRSAGWAAAAARGAIRLGLSANQISFLGIVAAGLGALALLMSAQSTWLFVAAAACIQLRLLTNLLDGMVAVEGGRGAPTGPIWNEFPDRVEDSLLLIAAGYASTMPSLGWLAALLAAVCAYVRLLGGALGQPQDFGGPMAKPHRMAALTLGCLLAFFAILIAGPDAQHALRIMALTLGLIIVGTALTIVLRLSRLSRALHECSGR